MYNFAALLNFIPFALNYEANLVFVGGLFELEI